MHDETNDRPSEEEALDRAMATIDPILQASLQRDQKRRRRQLLWGGIAMISLVGLLAIMIAMPGPQDGELNGDPDASAAVAGSTDDQIANAEKAGELGKRAWQLWRSGKATEASGLFAQAVDLDPQNKSLWNGWGWSLMHQQQYEDAYDRFRSCLELDNQHGGALNGAGQAQFFLGNYKKAEPYFQRAGGDAPAALFGLARLQLLQGKYAEAKDTLNKLAESDVSQLDRDLLAAMFEAAKAKKLPPELRKKLAPPQLARSDKQPAAGGGNANQLNARGWQLFNQGKARAAEVAFKQALEQSLNHMGAQNGLGFALLNQGNHREAKPIFEKLVKTNKSHAGFVNGLARCYELAGDPAEAIRLWKTVDTDDEVTACTWGIARNLTEQGEFAEALKYWQRIQRSAPQDPTVQQMIEKCEQGA